MGRSGSEIVGPIFDKIQNGEGKQILLQWDMTEDEIAAATEELIARAKGTYDTVAAVTEPTWDNTLGQINTLETAWHVLDSSITYAEHVSPDKKLRDAATKANEKLSAFNVDVNSRYDLYQSIQRYEETKPGLEGEQARFLDRTLRNFRRNGLHLDEKIRDEIRELNKKKTELQITFSKNLSEENQKMEFSEEELAGCTETFIKSLEKTDSGKLQLTLKYPHYHPIMKLCKVDETRRKMEFAFNCRCKENNTPILEELVQLRHKIAELMGYPTHAAFIQEIRMAKNPEAVKKFLSELSTKLTPLAEKEMQVLLDLKKETKAASGEEFDGKLNAWDLSFYRNVVMEKIYNVDHEEVRQYFPIGRVTEGLLGIYQELLSLKFTEVKDADRWHPDVQLFEVKNKADDALVGYFYLDMHPREGKYGHAACWGLQPSCAIGNNGRLIPVASVVCNFTKPTADKPSLLLHDEVETFFHEFGHCMHQLCSLADIAMFAGTNVERDFVEAPSQMLENWCWDEAALNRMSGRISDGSPLPAALIDTLVKARNANAGTFNKRQISLGTFDQVIHTQASADTAATLAEVTKDVCGYDMTPGTNMSASFGHLGGGYDAQYYGYLWSEVFSMDMFETKFKEKGLFNPEVGMEYRTNILQPGGSVDASEMIRNFLGRDPSPNAFLRSKGLEVPDQ